MRNLEIVILFIMLMSASCVKKEQPTEILRLDKLTKVVSYVQYLEQREVVLISNPPYNKESLDSLINDYVKNHSILTIIDSINTNRTYDSITVYNVHFYKKTKCTSYYIEHGEDKRHEIEGDGSKSSEGCEADNLGMFFYERSKDNPKVWYSTYPKDYHDTIYCK